ncbi:DNA-binding response regulator, partial [Streptomyces sp. SID8455]|nr:DNA-binding response regulator [Streptomyces sp. SID8455]
MREDGKITVFLLDDHEVVRRGVHELLASEPDIEVVGEAGTAA